MNDNYLDKIKQGREDSARKAEEDKRASLIVDAVGSAGKETKNEVTTAIHDLMLATLVSKDPRLVEVSKGLSTLFTEINKASKAFESSSLKDIPKVQQKIVDALQSIPDTIAEADKSPELKPYLESIVRAIQAKDTNPRVSVNPNINLSPITTAIESLEKSLKDLKPKEHKEADFSELEKATRSVEKAITSMRFPTANYILPYKDPTTGKATQVVLDSNGNVPITGSITVDTTGLATSAKQDAQTALLTTIDADTSNLDVALSTRATAAKQDTGNTSLSSIDGKITAVNTGAVVVSSSALPSGAATAAKQPALGTAGTASADVITVQGRSGMTALTVDGSGVTQPVSGSVTANAGTNLNTSALALSATQTDGSQKTQIVDAGGEQVTVTGGKLDVNATLTGSGGGTSAVDDAAFAVGTDTGTPSMGLFDDVTPDSVGEGDVGVVRMSANRNAYTTIRDAAGNERGVNVTAGNALTVDASATTQPVSGTFWQATQPVSGTVAVTGVSTAANQTTIIGHVDGIEGHVDGIETLIGTTNTTLGTIDADTGNISTKIDTIAGAVSGTEMQVDVASIAAGDNNIGNVDIASIAAGDNNIGNVDIASALPAGTNAIGKLSANSGVDIGDVDVTSAVSATLDHGSNLDIDTSAEQITSTSFACKFGVTLRAPIANTGILYIGNSDVTASGTAATDGIPLYPGDSLFLPVTNSNIPYAIASANNQTIYWMAV